MKKDLLNQKNKYLAIIYRDVLQHKPIREIHRNLLKATINPNKTMLAYMFKVADKAKKFDKGAGAYYSIGLDVLAVAIVRMISVDAVNHKATVIADSEVKKYESEQKAEILVNSWKENRSTGHIFYIASKHADSAKDHEPWQGKVYVDRYWHNYDTDGRLGKYIRDHDIRTVQWVTGKPIWFVTRPNCRHYFTSYSIDQVLAGKFHIPNRKIGDRRLQTPAGVNVEYYENRLVMLQGLYRQYKTDLLRKQIEKTKLLISKWKKVF